MIRDLKPYPAYRDSGLPWLKRIPSSWHVLRGKNVFHVVDVRSETGEEELLTVSSKDGVVPRSQKTVTMFKAESYVGHKLCWPGDLVVNSLWAWMQGLGFTRHHGLVSSAYSVYRLSPKFRNGVPYFDYTLRSAAYKWELMTRSKGVWLSRLQLSDAAFLDMPILVPSLEEQFAMVRFLDHADRRIQRYIRAKKKLIGLLNDQKQIIIHRAVTRGVDPDVRLKPSGVEWLGDVPEHWKIWKIGHFGRVGNGSTPSRGKPAYWNGGTYPWLNSSSVNRGRISDADQFVTDLALRECHLPRVQPGSVMVAITGQGKTRGTAAVLTIEATINQHIAYVTPRSNVVLPDYLLLAFVGAYRELRSISDDSGSTKGALTCGDIKHFKVALPPPEEQARIVSWINRDTQDIEAAVTRTEREISLLREYRTRLIADVVTGKLDVREAAARLPEEVEEPEPFDGDEVAEEGEDADVGADGEEAEA
jgi:type I restriction enzyme, S subunit